MYYLRPSDKRGQANFGWLESKHSFSFGHYYDNDHMGFSVIRVINDDVVMPSAGFDRHAHRDMEIISYILHGAIEHQDSMGQQHIVKAGEIQCMSAGSGVTHSEFNHSKNEKLHFLQIWIQPNKKGITPSYAQKAITQQGVLTPLVTADGRDGSLTMQQDAYMYRLQLQGGKTHIFNTEQRPGYLHMLDGKLATDEGILESGDALGAFKEQFNVQAKTSVTALWFDLPG